MTRRRSSGRASSTESSWPCDTITCCWRPTPVSESNSWMSSSRHGTPLIAYSLSPLRNSVREIVTSVKSIGRRWAVLSIVRLTSARPSAGRLAVPAKMTSSIFWLRTALGACAPNTQPMASTTFDLPLPFGPTTTVTPGSISSDVVSANDLKPFKVRVLRNISASGREVRGVAGPSRACSKCRQCGGRAAKSDLTVRAVEGRSVPVLLPHDGRPAAAARLSFAVVRLVQQLELAGPAVEVDVLLVAQRRPPVLHRLVQHLDDGSMQPTHLH